VLTEPTPPAGQVSPALSAMAEVTPVGLAAAVATLANYTTGLLYGFYTRFLYSGNLFGTIVLIFCLYIGGQLPFKLIMKHFQAILSILCCAYITTTVVIFINTREGNVI
jgi:hypothetical protein